MKLTIKGAKITNAKVTNHIVGEGVSSIEIEFEKDMLWSDLEMWLEDDGEKLTDYARINCSIKNKLKFSK